MKITFLGSGDAFGSGGRFQACIHVETGAVRFLMDCGASSLIAMKRFAVDPGLVDAILISHLHGDHFGGLPFFILDAQFSRRTRPLTIVGPPGVEARVRDAMEVLFPRSSRVERRFTTTFKELQDRTELNVGALSVVPYAVVHPSGAPPFALRVAGEGKVVAYSGDTEWTGALVDAARGADVFICEAYYFDKPIKYHLDYQSLMKHRTQLDCKKLVVTHMSPDMLRRRPDVGIETAEDGKTILL